MKNEDEIVMYIIFRKDLKLSPGKIAAQAGHAVQWAMKNVHKDNEKTWVRDWELSSYTKIALQVDQLADLEDLATELENDNQHFSWVIDSGRTEVEPNTVTCMALQPMPRSLAKKYVGSLGLMR